MPTLSRIAPFRHPHESEDLDSRWSLPSTPIEGENDKRGVSDKIKSVVSCQLSVARKAEGFTLIELLIVISIIAILVASATYSWQNAQQKGRDGKRKSDVKAVQQALEFYYQNNGKYADTDGNGKIKCAGAATPIDWGQAFTCNSVSYMQQLPKDPISTNSYYFTSAGSPPNSYAVFATIENTKDPDLTNLPSCTMPSPSYNYCVINP